ncbi:amino acid ABC transporter permease [Acetobacter nitrogenifigens DSM 23921 = NBRC 105050]|uniref:Glutamine ABC transporter permease GlnP n=1 Tax=Acetobacter nitrogenifigens DSM 23921 = NBRC 105050 TaxID=1120919 RepID=A0A511XC01_9PROT|nr:ABC transporter permease subunit [Acetobacter nitrogenifigens]GBQ88476.1 amino acid ABC transporter permease [Acetobacter nitrogenifigens DSM 23921 = NBRC 105050]GEN60415.1 glutamine ABC transporter permease GlnP [Acetobacter nitrogenifigens DSM 23921 = NBRC 105050]
MNLDWSVLISAFPDLMQGLQVTLLIAISGLAGGIVSGVVAGVALEYGGRISNVLAHIYVALIRGTPIVVQVMFIFFALPLIAGIRISSIDAAIITIIINSGAYNAEIIRGALNSVPGGIQEAGLAMGLSFPAVLAHIIAPLAFRRSLPAMGNQLVNVVKDTSIFIVIGVGELTRRGQEVMAENFRSVEVWSEVAAIYFVVISAFTLGLRVLERRMRLP